MILAIDVYYTDEGVSRTVGILFNHWTDSQADSVITHEIREGTPLPYIPGQFYKRELPPILSLLGRINPSIIDTVIVDGYVDLIGDNDEIIPGLGRHLWEKLEGKVEVVGIAKSPYRNITRIAAEVIRGKHGTTRPIYVQSSTGNNRETGEKVRGMAGEYRIPDLLRLLDKETKKKED